MVLPALGAPAACAIIALLLSACQGSAGASRVTVGDAGGDGTLRIGLLLDNTGDQDFLNAPQLAAATLAVREINAAGGHKGKPVELLPAEPGADIADQARRLVAAEADVVIGPTDSSSAPAAISVFAAAQIAVISPANSANALSRSNSGGYYFRTAAADDAQAAVLIKLAADGGARTLAVLHESGTYGSEVAAAVRDAAQRAGLEPVADVEFVAGQAQAAADAARSAAPDAVILIARTGAQGAIAELQNVGMAGRRLILSDGSVDRYGAGLAGGALAGARGILPGTLPTVAFQAALVGVDPGLRDMTFAASTYDAVNLAAIAAAAAQDDAGRSIAAWLPEVSGGAAPIGAAQPAGDRAACVSFLTCRDVLRAGQRPDYDGRSGRIGFDAGGDITEANYMVFQYGDDNLASHSGNETVSTAPADRS